MARLFALMVLLAACENDRPPLPARAPSHEMIRSPADTERLLQGARSLKVGSSLADVTRLLGRPDSDVVMGGKESGGFLARRFVYVIYRADSDIVNEITDRYVEVLLDEGNRLIELWHKDGPGHVKVLLGDRPVRAVTPEVKGSTPAPAADTPQSFDGGDPCQGHYGTSDDCPAEL